MIHLTLGVFFLPPLVQEQKGNPMIKTKVHIAFLQQSSPNKMVLAFLHSLIRRVMEHGPLLLRAVTWTILLTLTVALASFAPVFAFVSAVSPSSSFSKSCQADGFVRIPSDFPKESLCLPSYMVRRSSTDFFVPTVLTALVVAGSAFAVRSISSWEATRA